MITLNEIREKYLNFFASKNCEITKSSSLVPNDPTLLFTNAGMVQFKNYFNGVEKPRFKRAVSSQKCVRAGGKHNDLENVGYTARHHTFFEMLGNFSFGDYFKKEAITWAWEFLTKELNIPAEKLVATVYYNDDEAYNIWKNVVGLSENKIIKISTKDNFWEMGDTGPCGPCSEIFYDHGPEIWGGLPGSPEEDGDRYIEIWNIVFTQFNRNEKGELEDLPKKNIDTGMGLERITAVLQGVHNNYDIDLFKKIIDNSKLIIGDGDIFCHRIIADHLRSSCFLIADGVLPSNEGRGYVLRRIMRRAMLQIHKLGCKTTSMYKLVPCLVNLMSGHFTELKEYETLIMDTLKIEEDKFTEALDKGIKKLDEKIKNIKNNILSGVDAFELYDTYGFPLDLTDMILKDRKISIDQSGFESEMKKQKERAKANWVGSGDIKNNELILKLDMTTNFEGYEKTTTNGAKILNIIKDNNFIDKANNGDEVDIILDKSCFYGESGGQVGDIGLMIALSNDYSVKLPFNLFEITNTLKSSNGIIIHKGKIQDGEFKVGDFVNLTINNVRRKQITANHSSAHLLQYALREIFGNKITQKGSCVDDKRLRFDVAFNGQISKENLRKIEEIVNEIIINNTETKTEIMSIEEAKKIGAMALFNEKYGDNVRVVFIGKNNKNTEYNKIDKKEDYSIKDAISILTAKNNDNNKYLSIELCGGCHIKRTGDIGCFKIIKEESIANGVRRIEAITGIEVLNYINQKNNLINEVNKVLKSDESKILEKVDNLLKENKELTKKLSDLEKNNLKNLKFEEKILNNYKVLFNELENVNANDYREVIIEKIKTNKDKIFVSYCKNNGKTICIIGVGENLINNINAVEFLKQLGGKGGGQKNIAMGNILQI